MTAWVEVVAFLTLGCSLHLSSFRIIYVLKLSLKDADSCYGWAAVCYAGRQGID
jgi:hypothetical protein